MLQRNCGKIDRVVRFVLGAILFAVGLFVLGGLEGDFLGQVTAVAGFLALVTGASGFCVLYVPFGISTLERQDREGYHEAG